MIITASKRRIANAVEAKLTGEPVTLCCVDCKYVAYDKPGVWMFAIPVIGWVIWLILLLVYRLSNDFGPNCLHNQSMSIENIRGRGSVRTCKTMREYSHYCGSEGKLWSASDRWI